MAGRWEQVSRLHLMGSLGQDGGSGVQVGQMTFWNPTARIGGNLWHLDTFMRTQNLEDCIQSPTARNGDHHCAHPISGLALGAYLDFLSDTSGCAEIAIYYWCQLVVERTKVLCNH